MEQKNSWNTFDDLMDKYDGVVVYPRNKTRKYRIRELIEFERKQGRPVTEEEAKLFEIAEEPMLKQAN
jgi:hypothetical protein